MEENAVHEAAEPDAENDAGPPAEVSFDRVHTAPRSCYMPPVSTTHTSLSDSCSSTKSRSRVSAQ